MKKAPGQKLSIAKAKDLMVSQFTRTSDPNNSFQGFDINCVGHRVKEPLRFWRLRGPEADRLPIHMDERRKSPAQVRTYVTQWANPVSGIEAEGIKSGSRPDETEEK